MEAHKCKKNLVIRLIVEMFFIYIFSPKKYKETKKNATKRQQTINKHHLIFFFPTDHSHKIKKIELKVFFLILSKTLGKNYFDKIKKNSKLSINSICHFP